MPAWETATHDVTPNQSKPNCGLARKLEHSQDTHTDLHRHGVPDTRPQWRRSPVWDRSWSNRVSLRAARYLQHATRSAEAMGAEGEGRDPKVQNQANTKHAAMAEMGLPPAQTPRTHSHVHTHTRTLTRTHRNTQADTDGATPSPTRPAQIRPNLRHQQPHKMHTAGNSPTTTHSQ